MRKLLFLICVVLIFVSCDRKQSEKPSFKIEQYFDSIININKDWELNDAIKEDINKAFKKDLVKKIDNGIFNDYPMIIAGVNECNNKYYVKFENYYYLNDYKDSEVKYNIRKAKFNFVGEVSKEEAFKIKEGQFFVLDINFINYLTLDNMHNYCVYVLYSPFHGLEKEFYSSGGFNLGTIAVKINGMKEYQDSM